jgi:hypothetical protein
MKDKVLMSKNNAQLVVGIPLFRRHQMDDNNFGYGVLLTIEEENPIAYVIDCGPEIGAKLFNADFVHEYLIDLGEL